MIENKVYDVMIRKTRFEYHIWSMGPSKHLMRFLLKPDIWSSPLVTMSLFSGLVMKAHSCLLVMPESCTAQ